MHRKCHVCLPEESYLMSHGFCVRVYARWTVYRAAGVSDPWRPGVQRGGARVHGNEQLPTLGSRGASHANNGQNGDHWDSSATLPWDTLRLQGYGPLRICWRAYG